MKVSLLISAVTASAVLAAGLTVVESSPAGILLDLDSGQIQFGTVEIQGSRYTTVALEGAQSLSEFGFPRLPVYRVWLEIPVGSSVDIEVLEPIVRDIGGTGLPVEPGVMSASKNEPYDSFTVGFDEDVYLSGQQWPLGNVRVVHGGMMRGRNLALVEVMPLVWNPAGDSFELLAGARIGLTFEGGSLAESFALAERYRAAGFEELLASTVVNYGTFEVHGGVDTPPAPYLIVGHSDFTDTVMDGFVAHKEAAGFDVTMVDLSVTGSSASEIEAYILNALENWPDPPVYVLLVGDTGFLPGNTATEYGGVTDLYYVTLPDGGYFPDAFIGRFSVQTGAECSTMAQRVIDYESAGTASGPWIQNTCWIASSDNYTVSEGTHNYCIDNFLNPRGYTWDKVYPVTYGSSAADAITSINGGVSMLTFSGHGSATSWADMSFNSGHFSQLTNDGMFPGVLSHACNTGDYGTGTAWCETWTRTAGKGGLWFLGCVPSSYWTEDDIQEKAEFEYFLQDEIYWAMGFCEGGKLAVYEYYSGGGRSKYYYEGYNLMGDPSVMMWTWPDVTGIEEGGTGPVPGNAMIQVANPVFASSMITITGSTGPATLEVFDMAGRLVSVPFQGELINTASFTWDTSGLATGIYFLRLTQGSDITSAKVTLLR